MLIMDSRQKGGASTGGFESLSPRSRATSDMKRVLDSLQPAKPCRLEEHVGNVCRTGHTGTAATEGAQGGVHHILYSTVGVYAE